MSRKVIITCAITGAGDTAGKNTAVPVTPTQIAESSLQAAQAGAAIVHIHVRDPKTGAPSRVLEHYREVVERIREKNPSVLLNVTAGPGGRFVPGATEPRLAGQGTTLVAPEARIDHILALRPEICTLDMGSINFGNSVLINTPEHLALMAEKVQAAGVKPELEIFDTGHLRLALDMVKNNKISNPPLFQFCLGIAWGACASVESLLHLRNQLSPGAAWSAFGIGASEFPILAHTALMGGHVRVGLEDNLYLSKDVLAPSNAALVDRAVAILNLLNLEPASPAEARNLLNLAR